MKILVRYWPNKEESRPLEIELPEQVSFQEVQQHVCQVLNQKEILLLLTLIKEAKDSPTASAYTQKISNEAHFNGFNPALFSEEEQKQGQIES